MKALILLLTASLFSFYSADNQTNEQVKMTHAHEYDMVYIYTWGIIENPVLQTKCAVKLQEKYGFGYQSQGSCMMDDVERMRRFNTHNREIRAILAERHGEDWERRFEKELENCGAQ